jgi:hypothetical protein
MKINKYGRRMMQLIADHRNCNHLWNEFIIRVILCCYMVKVKGLGNGLNLIYQLLRFGQPLLIFKVHYRQYMLVSIHWVMKL